MLAYALRRLLETIPVLVLTSVAIFLLIHLVPGDPALILAGPDATPDVVAAVRQNLGLDQPLPVQYVDWATHVLHGDLGKSYISGFSVWKLVMLKLPVTLELTVAALLLSLIIAIPTGILAAVRPRSWIDLVISTFTAIGLGVPVFWLGILFILLFSLSLNWLPPGGRVGFERGIVPGLKYLAMPALTLAIPQAAIFSRFLKGSLVEVLQEDYIRTARSKGLPERWILSRHVIRNALIPFVTILGVQFGRLLGGAVIIEAVFAWPGVGQLLLTAIGDRDYSVVQGGLLLLVTTFVFINLLVDLSYGLIDPRIQESRSGGRS